MSICTTDSLHSVKNVVLVQKEDTRKKMLLKSGTGGLTMAKYIELEALKNRFAKRLVWLKRDIHMEEYISREKAKSLLHIEYAYAAEQLLDEIPAADVAPVVRCKDCKHEFGGSCILCGFQKRKPEDFCSYGERKDGADAEG